MPTTPELKLVRPSTDLDDVATAINEVKCFAHCLIQDCFVPTTDREAGNRRSILAHELEKRLDTLDAAFEEIER